MIMGQGIKSDLKQFNHNLIHCTNCPRLVEFRTRVAVEKRKQFMDWDYWGKPVPGYGDPEAAIIIVGLAPAAHGGNRTGRVFTGDKSADFLMMCMHEVGMANQPNSDHMDDGLILDNCYMTPALKCVPPQDKPNAEELRNCFSYFGKEMAILTKANCMLALGKIAFDTCLRFWRNSFDIKVKDHPFRHHSIYKLPNGFHLVGGYHPSPRNVNTGRLSKKMMIDLLNDVKNFI